MADEWDENYEAVPKSSHTFLSPVSSDRKRRYQDGGWNSHDTRSRYEDNRRDERNFSPRNDRRDYRRDDRRNDQRDHRRDQGYNRYSNGYQNEGGSREFSRRDGNGSGISETFYIKSWDAGSVIGKGGSVIREIQDKFQVKVNIDKNVAEEGRAKVTISGNDRDKNLDAKKYIEEMLSKNEPYDPYGNRGDRIKNDDNAGAARGIIDWDAVNKQCEEAQKERWAKCPKILKKFYEEHPEITAMSDAEADEFRKNNMSITVCRTFVDQEKGSDPIPKPVLTFEHGFFRYPELLDEIQKQGFEKPSPIQAQAWPVLLNGEDLIGIAQTGTGKTLAFLLPALIHIENQPVPRGQRGGPNVLILAPTRELAQQIEKEVLKYQFRGIKACCVYGGGERQAQIDLVKNGVEIIIATPGRFNDLVASGVIDITSVTYLVLDEADRMLDMGFEPQIRKLLLDIRPDRQTVMTSATWPPGVRRLASSYMENPIQVHVGSLDLAATHTVTQIVEIIDEEEKYERVVQFVKEMGPDDKAIIFCGKKQRADDLSSEFSLMNIPCQSIHGNREQCDREQALEDIRNGTVRILVATDVASRGIDIEDITWVINYDFPRNIEEYVHRVGRTGRAGRSGKSLSLMTRSDWGSAAELIKILEEADQEVPEEIRTMAERFKTMKDRKAEEARNCGVSDRGFRGRDRGERSGGDDNSCSFKTAASNVGAIIGKGGSNIREMQQKFNVRINVDKNFQNNESQITVSGSNYDQVKDAIESLKKQCAESRSDRGRRD